MSDSSEKPVLKLDNQKSIKIVKYPLNVSIILAMNKKKWLMYTVSS